MNAMQGHNIICFAKDYDEAATSNHHVMRALAERNNVLWLDSVATRTPRLGNGRDIRKIATKLRKFVRGPERVGNMWRFTPLVLPLPHSPLATRVNRILLRATVRALRKRLGMSTFQLWTFLPTTADYVGCLDESLVVYYCVDEWSLFQFMDRQRVAEADRRLCERADVIFAVTDSLVEPRRAINSRAYLAPHGVDHALFSRALDRSRPLPPEVAALPRPVIGYFGTIADWIDQELIAYLAERHPAWSFVLVGPEMVATSRLAAFRNIHRLGPRPHHELPDYCRAFSVGLMPFVRQERMRFVNPLKLREYLSAGLPVISTPVSEVDRYAPHVVVADSYPAFEAAIEDALARDSDSERRARSEAVRGETWDARVADIEAHITRVMESKEQCRRSAVTVPA